MLALLTTFLIYQYSLLQRGSPLTTNVPREPPPPQFLLPPDQFVPDVAEGLTLVLTSESQCDAINRKTERNEIFNVSNKYDPTKAAYEGSPPSAYPAALHIFSCVMLIMAFYNFLLKANQSNWKDWLVTRKVSALGPILSSLYKRLCGILPSTLRDPDNPTPMPAYHRPRNTSSKGGNRRKAMLATLALLSGRCALANNLATQSERRDRDMLRPYRGPNGMLHTEKLPSHMRCYLSTKIAADAELFAQAAMHHSDIIYTITDTGASTSCTPDDRDFLPGTKRKLKTPIRIGGIAGDIVAEYEGTVSWEVLDINGNLLTFETTALLCPDLPCRLFSPQAFLSQSQNLDDHFRVYGDRSEWHMYNQKLLSLPYDQSFLPSFLPRMTMFRQGTA